MDMATAAAISSLSGAPSAGMSMSPSTSCHRWCPPARSSTLTTTLPWGPRSPPPTASSSNYPDNAAPPSPSPSLLLARWKWGRWRPTLDGDGDDGVLDPSASPHSEEPWAVATTMPKQQRTKERAAKSGHFSSPASSCTSLTTLAAARCAIIASSSPATASSTSSPMTTSTPDAARTAFVKNTGGPARCCLAS
uniref:Uncharacterized protein n=1 Tax=Oryza rufipogon TaxID=4529 RepID=A0A0E0NFW4_ORYRU